MKYLGFTSGTTKLKTYLLEKKAKKGVLIALHSSGIYMSAALEVVQEPGEHFRVQLQMKPIQ
jgi:hypothetical protein